MSIHRFRKSKPHGLQALWLIAVLLLPSSLLLGADIKLHLVFDLETGLYEDTKYTSENVFFPGIDVTPGTTFDVTFSFARGDVLRFDSNPGENSTESIRIVMSKPGEASGAGSVRSDTVLHLDISSGDVLTSTGSSSSALCLNCMALRGDADFTDGTMSISGGRFLTTASEIDTGFANFTGALFALDAANARRVHAREFTIDLEETTFPELEGFFSSTSAFDFADVSSGGPVLFNEGDEFDFVVRFKDGQALTVDGSVLTDEAVVLQMLAAANTVEPFGLGISTVTTELLGLSGAIASEVFSATRSCINCLSAGGDHNISDGLFSFTGIRFSGKVDQLFDTSLASRGILTVTGGGQEIGVVPNPIPEPGTWLLTLAGGAFLFAYRRRFATRHPR
jgi:hypothetical protein